MIVSSLNIFNEHFLGGKIFEWVTKDAPSLAITTCVSIRYRVKLYKLNIETDVNITSPRNKDRLGCYTYVSGRPSTRVQSALMKVPWWSGF